MYQLSRYFLVSTAFFLVQNLGAQAVSPAINDVASRVFGQPKLQANIFTQAPNLVEGRELSSPQAIAFDTSVSPPIVYVSDTGNNRVLAWRNASSLSKGNFADLVIGQRNRDFTSTLAQGPGNANTLSTGLALPGALAVDRQGNLYVADTGNNRILRYPAPFNQTGDLLQVDLVIGQKTVSSGRQANQGLTAPTSKTLSFLTGAGAQVTGLAFDPAGNLWASDPFNNRVLRYPVASLSPNTPEPAADVVLGQPDFTVGTAAAGASVRQDNRVNLFGPSSIAFDTRGNLYVADSLARVLYYGGPFQGIGISAARVLGVNPIDSQGRQITPYPNNFTLGSTNSGGGINGNPNGVFTVGDNLFVTDTPQHRVVHYGLPESWPAATNSQVSPPLIGSALGQLNFTSGKANREKVEPDATTLALPSAGAALGNEIWIVDTGNNRVLSFGQDSPLSYSSANRLVGQADFNLNQPNLIEGREVNFGSFAGGVVFDRNSNPPHLYVADFANNRILGFRDGRKVLPGQKADLVIGQPDMFHAVINYPNGAAGPPNDSGLFGPTGVAVDANGNLIVADSFNSRLLRFPSPFDQPAGMQRANLVLGQFSFTSSPVTDPSSQNMGQPWGLAFLADGSIAASDVLHNRVLIFRKPRNGDFQNFQRADAVLGQNDFNSRLPGNGINQLDRPRHMGIDSSDRLYVADLGNNRVMIFPVGGVIAPTGLARAVEIPGLNQPQGVTVSLVTGEAFIANTGQNQVARVPEFTKLLFDGPTITANIASNGPLDIALDPSDNVVIAEGVNRVAFFYAKSTYQNAASYNQQGLAPGMLTYLYRLGKAFNLTDQTLSAPSLPWPTVLGDIQVTVNGTPAPIFTLSSSRIDFQVPQNAPTTGFADFLVTRVSTGEILAAASLPMVPSNPGFFTLSQTGAGQLAATDSTGKTNSPSAPIKVGTYITLYGTGLGVVPGAPPDGAAPSGGIPAPKSTVVIINGTVIDLSKDPNAFSGLGAFPGGWQINVKVPSDVVCNTTNVCPSAVTVVLYDGNYRNNVGPTGQITTTIATTQ
jgi:uncharacterized protein (TIGR03437 family)